MKYKKSINCNRPKGFSQKQYCKYGTKKNFKNWNVNYCVEYNKMSILNHFGKVTASYKKYNSDLPEYKGYMSTSGNLFINPYTSKRDGKIYYDGGIRRDDMKLFEPEGYKDNPNIEEVLKYKKESRFTLEDDSLKDVSFMRSNYKPILNFPMTTDIGAPYHKKLMTIPVSSTYNPCISPELYVFSFTTVIETFSKCLEKVREKLSSELWKTIEYCPLISIIDLLLLKHSDTDKHIEHLEEIIKALIDDSKLLQTKIISLESRMNLFKSKIPVAVAISESCEKTIGEEILNE